MINQFQRQSQQDSAKLDYGIQERRRNHERKGFGPSDLLNEW